MTVGQTLAETVEVNYLARMMHEAIIRDLSLVQWNEDAPSKGMAGGGGGSGILLHISGW